MRKTHSGWRKLADLPGIRVILEALLTAVQPILGPQFIGLYLTGSLASGDFNPDRSDIDFIVATADDLPDETIATLAAMHTRLRANGTYWATRLEGDYIPLAALRRHDPARLRYPHLGDEGHFAVEEHNSNMVIQYHILREKGVVLSGPPPHTLIDPIGPDELKQAVQGTLRVWWQPMLDDPTRMQSSEYQAFAVLTMCRMLYTFQVGDVVSKPAAAKWAMEVGDGHIDSAQCKRFTSLIQQANTWHNGMPFDKLEETLDFIDYVIRKA
jgi:hypothetical protein